MKKGEKKEKPTPKRCVCGAEAIFVRTILGKMYSCQNPTRCKANLRTAWNKNQDQAIIEWNSLVEAFQARELRRRGGR